MKGPPALPSEPSKLEPVPENTINDVTDIVGAFGPWQLVVFLTVIYVEVIAAIYNYASPLLAAPVKFECDLNATLEYYTRTNGSSYSDLTIGDLAQVDGGCKFSIISSDTNTTETCKRFTYLPSVYTRSAAEEFDLICDRNWLISFSSSMTLLGDLVACMVFGHLADRIGRRKTMLVALATTIVAPMVTLFSRTYAQFVIGRFLCGASGYGYMIVSYVMLMEIVGIKYRGIIGIMVKLGYTIGGVYIGLVAYWLRNWFYIQIASTVPVIILIVLCYIIPESPRWLISHGYTDEAEKVIEKAVKWNKKSTKDITSRIDLLCKKILQEQENQKQHYTFLDLLKTPNTRWKTLILIVSWGVAVFVYYGISLNANTFSTDMFVSFISVCLIEILAHFLCVLGTHYIGCKVSLYCFFFFTSLVCFIGAGTQKTEGWEGIVLISLMKMGATGATDLSYNISAEIFPTVVRAIGMGVCSTFARVTAMVSPFMKELAKLTSVSVPFGLFGGLCFLTAILIFFLPDTYHRLLPETLEEGEKIELVCPLKVASKKDVNVTKEATSDAP